MSVQDHTKTGPQSISLWKLITSQSFYTHDVLEHDYKGSGTTEDPYQVVWLPKDTRNPFTLPKSLKWMITMIQATAFLSITFASSALSAANPQIEEYFGSSETLTIADTSLFILAFAIGPAIWAPLAEIYGRQIVCISCYGLATVCLGGTIASNNIATLLVLRFFAGAFGASSIVNSGGVVSDLFEAKERALGMLAFVGAPFLGPSIGPIAGDFLAVAAGWRWVAAMIAIFTGVAFVGNLFVPETYHPVLLKRRAARLSRETGKIYKSQLEIENGQKSPTTVFYTNIVRPWALLFKEPIVFCLSIYMAFIYGTLYMLFPAFPIVFQEARGWPQSTSGLAFVGIAVGQIIGVVYSALDNTRYKKVVNRSPDGVAPPEARLMPSILGSVFLPIGLFVFAWTNYPSIHWIACEVGTAFLGFGHVGIFLSVTNYLVDAYTLYAASALAANAIIRALFGAAFPLFADPMFHGLGIHWGASIPAFLALACAPFPTLFYIYGPKLRRNCPYAAESARLMDKLHGKKGNQEGSEKGEVDEEKDLSDKGSSNDEKD